MANRVLIGYHPWTTKYGMYVTKPGLNVTDNNTANNDFAFRSDIVDNNVHITEAYGKTYTVVDYQTHNVTFSSTEKVKAIYSYYNRSLFNDGSTDRCPLVFVQTTVKNDYTKHNAIGFLYYYHTSGDYRTSQGFRYRHFPYYNTTQGMVRINIQAEARAVYASGTESYYNMSGLSEGDWPGTDTNQRTIYVAVCDLCVAST